jgi:hypothetical protein
MGWLSLYEQQTRNNPIANRPIPWWCDGSTVGIRAASYTAGFIRWEVRMSIRAA